MLDTETGSLKVIDRPETSAYTKEVTFFRAAADWPARLLTTSGSIKCY